jgi:hypothetical protein
MAETMMERVARAIYEASPHNKPYSLLTALQREKLAAEARSAISAMREPTPEVEAAYLKACDESGACLWRTAWRVMIDAATR